jgi:hypothetical protein
MRSNSPFVAVGVSGSDTVAGVESKNGWSGLLLREFGGRE